MTYDSKLDRSIKREPSECGSTWYGCSYRRISIDHDMSNQSFSSENSPTKSKPPRSRSLLCMWTTIIGILGILIGIVLGLYGRGRFVSSSYSCFSDITKSAIQEELRRELGDIRSSILADLREELGAMLNFESEIRRENDKMKNQIRILVDNKECGHLTACPVPGVAVSLNHSSLISLDDRIKKVEGRVKALANERTESTAPKQRLNYASSQYGASVVHSLTSDTLYPRSSYPILDYFVKIETHGYPIFDRKMSRLGDCWCFNGAEGNYAVRLAFPAKIDEVIYNHSPWSDVKKAPLSAPKQYQIWGCYDDVPYEPIDGTENCVLMGDCVYRGNGSATINGCLIQNPLVVPILQMRISSNHGGEYTCLYSIKAHGKHECDENKVDCPFSSQDSVQEGVANGFSLNDQGPNEI